PVCAIDRAPYDLRLLKCRLRQVGKKNVRQIRCAEYDRVQRIAQIVRDDRQHVVPCLSRALGSAIESHVLERSANQTRKLIHYRGIVRAICPHFQRDHADGLIVATGETNLYWRGYVPPRSTVYRVPA